MYEPYSPQAIWGRELRHYRLQAGLTQLQLAEQAGFSESTISTVETGHAPATIDFAKACEQVLQTGGALLRTLDYRKGERPHLVRRVAPHRNQVQHPPQLPDVGGRWPPTERGVRG